LYPSTLGSRAITKKKRNAPKHFNDFHLEEAKAIIWPGLSYMCHIRFWIWGLGSSDAGEQIPELTASLGGKHLLYGMRYSGLGFRVEGVRYWV